MVMRRAMAPIRARLTRYRAMTGRVFSSFAWVVDGPFFTCLVIGVGAGLLGYLELSRVSP